MNGSPDATIDISDAELDVTLQKACVGVGLDLGTGIELGRAALTMRFAGIDPAPVFATALRKFGSGDAAEEGDFVLAISDGPAVCDRFIAEGGSTSGLLVDYPLIVLALLSARGYCGRMTMADCDDEAVFRNHTLCLKEAVSSAALTPSRIALRQESADKLIAKDTGGCGFRGVDAVAWREICDLAARCLVSGSDESRLNDAGAGLIDED